MCRLLIRKIFFFSFCSGHFLLAIQVKEVSSMAVLCQHELCLCDKLNVKKLLIYGVYGGERWG